MSVLLKEASSFSAAAISFSVFKVLGAPSTRFETAVVTYAVVATFVLLSLALCVVAVIESKLLGTFVNAIFYLFTLQGLCYNTIYTVTAVDMTLIVAEAELNIVTSNNKLPELIVASKLANPELVNI